MMDPIQSFFHNHHAVIADGCGPQWCRASDEALLAWAKADCREWERSTENHPCLVDRMQDIGNELERRAAVVFRIGSASMSLDDAMAWARLFCRAGRVWACIGDGRRSVCT